VLQSLELGALEKYNPAAVESSWYAWWEKEGFFKPQMTADNKVKSEGMFVITLPPPNVTGSLHIGHALTAAIQDTLVRWYTPEKTWLTLGIVCLESPSCISLDSITLESQHRPSLKSVSQKIRISLAMTSAARNSLGTSGNGKKSMLRMALINVDTIKRLRHN
jgi:hypothetical protein